MRGVGVVLAIVGLIWGIVAFNMSTTVEAGGESVGSIYVPRQEVHNLDLTERRRTHLLISGMLVIVGSVLFGFGSVRNASATGPSTDTRKCPFCAELVKREAKICKHCGKELPEFKPEQIADSTSGTQPAYNSDGQLVIKMCPSCRATNNGFSEVCTRCGATLPA